MAWEHGKALAKSAVAGPASPKFGYRKQTASVIATTAKGGDDGAENRSE